MTREKVLLDTGPLVAFLNKQDKYHFWATSQLAAIQPPLFTCEAVLSESCFLLRNLPEGVISIMKLLERELVKIPFRLERELSALKKLLKSYKDVPMSLADGCLVRMSEQITDSVVFTLDRDFKVYRKHKRQVIPTIMPDHS